MKRHFSILMLLGCGAVFVFGLLQLFQLRFTQGDVYPAYSSLRADPLGTMALYESLQKIPGLSARRDFSDSNRMPEEPQTVYWHLASPRYEWEWIPQDLFHQMQMFLARGNRLVITYFPQTGSYVFHESHGDEGTNSVKSAKSKDSKAAPAKPGKKIKNPDEEDTEISLETEWGFHPSYQRLAAAGEAFAPAKAVNQTDLPLPRELDWHSGLVFTNCDRAWRTIYARGTNAVVIERKFGKGSVVIATDSFFASNEAMSQDRHADWLAWLIGPNQNAVFDEAHFGIVETSGVVLLMRKYHLQGFAAGLILLAGLFIWKSSTSLAPPHQVDAKEGFVAGKDSAAGVANLLRRNLAPRNLLATCFSEWKKTVAPTGRFSAARIQKAEAVFQAEAALPNKDRNPVAAYQNIANELGTRTKKL